MSRCDNMLARNMATKRQLKQLSFDDLLPKKKRDSVEGKEASWHMDHFGECSLNVHDSSDCSDEASDSESDSESNDTLNYDDNSDSFTTDHSHHANKRGIWHNSICVDQRNSNSTFTIVNNQSSVLNKSSCASLLPASSTSTRYSNNQMVPVVPSDIAASPNQSPVQPILQYPVAVIGGKR